MFLLSIRFLPWDAIASFWKEIRGSEASLAFVTVVFGSAVLLFTLVSTFLGFVLAALSYDLVERLWELRSLINFDGLVKFIGLEDADRLKQQFKIQFGYAPKDDSPNRASFLCAYYIWRMDPNLGAMQGRLDSDNLAARNSALVSFALLVMSILEGLYFGFDLFIWICTILLPVILSGSALAFHYHRKKRVYGRFEMFVAVSGSTGRDKTEAPNPPRVLDGLPCKRRVLEGENCCFQHSYGLLNKTRYFFKHES
jgi:hypothetical protein